MSTEHETSCTITEDDLWAVPLEQIHKTQVVGHYHRLWKSIFERPGKPMTDCYTDRQIALQQLARMTLVITDYTTRHRIAVERGELPNHTIESMIMDVIDAALFVPGTKVMTTANPQLWGREKEIAFFVQQLDPATSEGRPEIWSNSTKLVPNSGPLVVNIGEHHDWNGGCLRSRSETNILHRNAGLVIDNHAERERNLTHGVREDLNWRWPP